MENAATGNHPQPPSSRRPRDLLISLLVLLAPVLLLVGGYQLLAGRDQPVAVDPTAEIVAARHAGLVVLEPTALGADWVPVTAGFRQEEAGPTLRLGYVTPAGAPVQVVQVEAPAAQVVDGELVPGATSQGQLTVAAGGTWQRYPARSGERALLREHAGVTVVVVGSAGEDELAVLAAALR